MLAKLPLCTARATAGKGQRHKRIRKIGCFLPLVVMLVLVLVLLVLVLLLLLVLVLLLLLLWHILY